jgi:hypothetical protein
MLALQVQYISQPEVRAGAGVPAEAVLEPGLALPPTVVRPPSPWLPALPWVGGALLVVGVLFVLGGRRRWPAVAGAVLAGSLLTSYVPPLSAVPNPAGVYYRLRGGYSYDPHLPFRNLFVVAGQPEEQLRPHLDALIGQVGLSPLDPNQPLAGYEILRVGLHPAHRDAALVTTRFIYADGSSRVYPVPLLGPVPGGLWMANWREDGLARLRSVHLDLPGQPFATATSPIQLGPARQLALSPEANRLDEVNPGHWLWQAVRVQHLVWAPDGRAFLAATEVDRSDRRLWRVDLDGSPPRLVASGDIYEYGWSPDGAVIVYTRLDVDAAMAAPTRPYAIMALADEPRAAPQTIATGLGTAQLPGLTRSGLWFFSDGTLWLAPYDGGTPKPVSAETADLLPRDAPRPSPAGRQVAFACGGRLCLMPVPVEPSAAAEVERLDYALAEAAWTADGDRLAVIHRPPSGVGPVRLVVLTAAGEVVWEADIAPGEATEPPQWTPDGAAVFVQTYPQDGRRIIAADVATRQVLDLSREHWDAYFALAPDGRRLLLNNGRGDWWEADVIR